MFNIMAKTSTDTAIEFLVAVRLGKEDDVLRLIDQNPKILNSVDEYNTNALLYAIKAKNVALAKLLIAKDINSSHKDLLGDTAKDLSEKYLSYEDSTEINALILQKESELWKKLAERQQTAHRDNPFNCANRPYFYCFDITACDNTPFTSLEQCSLLNANQVNTYIGSVILNLTVTKESAGNIMNPSTHTKTNSYAQSVVIDLLPEPNLEGDYIKSRGEWKNAFSADEIFQARIKSVESKAIVYFADYDINKILVGIENFVKSY